MKKKLKSELDKHSKENPLTQPQMMTELISIPKSYIPSTDYLALIQSQQLIVSHQAEMIRHDLSALVSVASKVTLQTIYAAIYQSLAPSNMKLCKY